MRLPCCNMTAAASRVWFRPEGVRTIRITASSQNASASVRLTTTRVSTISPHTRRAGAISSSCNSTAPQLSQTAMKTVKTLSGPCFRYIALICRCANIPWRSIGDSFQRLGLFSNLTCDPHTGGTLKPCARDELCRMQDVHSQSKQIYYSDWFGDCSFRKSSVIIKVMKANIFS